MPRHAITPPPADTPFLSFSLITRFHARPAFAAAAAISSPLPATSSLRALCFQLPLIILLPRRRFMPLCRLLRCCFFIDYYFRFSFFGFAMPYFQRYCFFADFSFAPLLRAFSAIISAVSFSFFFLPLIFASIFLPRACQPPAPWLPSFAASPPSPNASAAAA